MKYRLFSLFISLILLTSCGPGENARPEVENASPVEDVSNRTVPPNPVEKLNADGVVVTHAISQRSEPKYPPDFTHFEYVNPEAPKGGTIVMAGTGTFGSFNRYAQRGESAPSSSLFYDTLTTMSLDEVEVYYGLIAEKMEYPPDYSWITFHIRQEARHQDGQSITADDVVFSFNKFMDEGVPQFKTYYANISSVEALDELRVKFTLTSGDKEMLISLGQLIILSPRYWEGRDLSEPLREPPSGSGAYIVSDYAMGQYVVYERLKDYWAMNIPAIKGTQNFDYIRYDMYRDDVVKLEALKAGKIDLRVEGVSKQWATQYTGPNFDAGYIKKEELSDESPPTIRRYIFNIQKEQLQDRQVREALGLMMDFEWLNKNLFYSQYTRTRSYFQNTPFEAMGTPSPEEVEILSPIRNAIPPRVFTQEYQPPKTDGSGNIRSHIARALDLLADAGWIIKDQKMVNAETDEPLALEFLVYSPSNERIAVTYQENLKKIGVDLQLRLVDTTQYLNRLHNLDYDMITFPFSGEFFPDSSLKLRWHSDYIDSTYNHSGVTDSAVDYLVEGIVEHQNDNAALVHWGRAFDRVLQWNHYGIFQWYSSTTRVAFWDMFDRPAVKPRYSNGLSTWWIDEEKEARLPSR